MLRLIVVLAILSACRAPRPPVGPGAAGSQTGELPVQPGAPHITWIRVDSPSDVPATPPPAGTFRIHLIDVGTGLAILVQGSDFNLLYDAGTNDKTEKPARVIAYLARAIGASGDDLCGPGGSVSDNKTIDDVVLSHPHFDHASALDLVVHCYTVKDIYDSGRVNDAVFYRAFLEAVSRSPATYHTAADVPSDHTVGVKGTEIRIPNWQRFSEGDAVRLGEAAKFTILHAEGKKLPDPNQNSVVIAVELGAARLLLVGDAESGSREDPSAIAGDVEEFLIENHPREIRADILQVGHHGSKTSSRHAFLDAVHPSLALVSSGPKVYGHTVLPDHEVIEELRRDGATVLRTDERDGACPVKQRIGPAEGPGGCDSYIITISPPQSAP
ncbi:ComEC/Rec2 family competence protein [soil metagenome]